MNPRSGSTVLVVDDSEIDRFLLRAILEGEGYRALSAPDGPTGRGLAAAALPDAILLDVVMPGEDGFATCAALKRDPRTASIPVLFLSALEDADSKVRGLAAGAVDYVTKPPNRDEVLARVALHIRLHRSTELLIREQAERLAVVGAAQKLLLTDPASVPEARVRVFHRTLHEAGGDFYEALPLGRGG